MAGLQRGRARVSAEIVAHTPLERCASAAHLASGGVVTCVDMAETRRKRVKSTDSQGASGGAGAQRHLTARS